jgi:hypothetical protein
VLLVRISKSIVVGTVFVSHGEECEILSDVGAHATQEFGIGPGLGVHLRWVLLDQVAKIAMHALDRRDTTAACKDEDELHVDAVEEKVGDTQVVTSVLLLTEDPERPATYVQRDDGDHGDGVEVQEFPSQKAAASGVKLAPLVPAESSAGEAGDQVDDERVRVVAVLSRGVVGDDHENGA